MSRALSLLHPPPEIRRENCCVRENRVKTLQPEQAKDYSILFNKKYIYSCWMEILCSFSHSLKKNPLLSCLPPQRVPNGIPLPPELKPPTRPKAQFNTSAPPRGKNQSWSSYSDSDSEIFLPSSLRSALLYYASSL